MKAEEAHTLVGAYVLDALDDLERVAVERHVADCMACSTEVAELRATAARLGGATAVTPPSDLRTRVMSDVHRTRQEAPKPRVVEQMVARPVVPRRRMWLVAAMAAAITAVAVGSTTYVTQQRMIVAERERGTAERANASRWESLMTAPDARVVVRDVTGGGRVSVVVSEQRGEAAVMMTDLPAVDRDHAYQLWLITEGSPVPSDVMAAGQRAGTLLLNELGAADSLGVTLEPAGGSQVPTLPVLAGVPLRT
ncbi:MAG: anti-sigma factor [Longispora sp.]|nr:anti-sigma factor [Longispora sp. (in: high G+C Gram-positive bacteria)]